MVIFDNTWQKARFSIALHAAAFVALSTCAMAASGASPYPFSGRWRMDTASLKGNEKPTHIKLMNGVFRKDDGTAILTDGKFHRVRGGGYVDETSITIENDHVVREIDEVGGKLAYTVKYVVSADGDTLEWHVGNYTSPDGQIVESQTVQHRTGGVINGAHLISGRWERASITVDAKSDWILKLDGNRFSWRTGSGTGYDAIIGGRSVKIEGDSSGARALVTRPKPDTIVETDYSAKGTFDDVLTMRLMSDHMTIQGMARTRKQKKPTTFYLHRQREQ